MPCQYRLFRSVSHETVCLSFRHGRQPALSFVTPSQVSSMRFDFPSPSAEEKHHMPATDPAEEKAKDEEVAKKRKKRKEKKRMHPQPLFISSKEKTPRRNRDEKINNKKEEKRKAETQQKCHKECRSHFQHRYVVRPSVRPFIIRRLSSVLFSPQEPGSS